MKTEFQCLDCGREETRVVSPHDDIALCRFCGSLMINLGEPVFVELWTDGPRLEATHDRGKP